MPNATAVPMSANIAENAVETTIRLLNEYLKEIEEKLKRNPNRRDKMKLHHDVRVIATAPAKVVPLAPMEDDVDEFFKRIEIKDGARYDKNQCRYADR